MMQHIRMSGQNGKVVYDLFFTCILLQKDPELLSNWNRFNDPLDRFYITTANFDPNKLFSDEYVPYADGMLVYFDKRHNGHKDHYMTKSSSIRLYWRTVVQFHSTLIDRFAAGFRLLAYPATSKSYVNTRMKYTALKMAVK